MQTTFEDLRDIKLVQSQNKGWIDREKSLKMVRLAELSLAKKRFANSNEKAITSPRTLINHKKETIIEQIRDKLTQTENTEIHFTNLAKQDSNQTSNVLRLERLLEKMKRERFSAIQPKIVHKRQVVNQSNGRKQVSRRNENLQQMLKEVTEAREEVREIKKINSLLLGETKKPSFAVDKAVESSHKKHYLQVQKTKSNPINDVYKEKRVLNFQFQREGSNNFMQNADILSASSFYLEQEKSNSKNNHLGQLYYHNKPPSEVIYSWNFEKDGKIVGNSSFTKIPFQSLQK